MSLLDQLYPVGLAKTASAHDEVDLSQVSAADYLAALEDDGSDGGEIDLDGMSAAELLDILGSEEEGEEKVAGVDDEDELLAAMIDNGTFAEMDLAGRIMARAQFDEMSKLAGVDDDEIDLNEISAEDLINLIESGEFELEKDAGKAGWGKYLKGKFSAGKEAVSKAAKTYKSDVSGKTTGKILAAMGAGKGKNKGAYAKAKMLAKGVYGSQGTKAQVRGLRRATASQVATGAAGAGAAYGGYRLAKKNR